MTRIMYDSVDVNRIPKNANFIAGYIDGLYKNVDKIKAHFPHAKVVTITVLGTPGANVCDCETGDLTPASAAKWAYNELNVKRIPTIYCSESVWPAVKNELKAKGILDKVNFWIAHYDNIARIPVGAVAKQYRSDTKADLDYSVVADHWPGVDPAPAHPVKPAPAPHPAPAHHPAPAPAKPVPVAAKPEPKPVVEPPKPAPAPTGNLTPAPTPVTPPTVNPPVTPPVCELLYAPAPIAKKSWWKLFLQWLGFKV